MSGMNKHIYLESRRCLRRGWYARNLPDDGKLGDADQFFVNQGTEIGILAHRLYPDGVLVEWTGLLDTVNQTRRLMEDPSVSVIFEATFHIGGYTTRADVLVRNGDGWRVVEVKSSLFDPEVEDKLIDDVCYTVMVARQCGINVNAASLLQLRPDFRRGMGGEQMFGEADLTAVVQGRMSLFSSQWSRIREATAQPVCPLEVSSGRACLDCPYYAGHCFGKGLEHPVRELPRIGDKISAFLDAGILDLRDTPGDFPLELNDQQYTVLECARSKKPYVAPGLKAALDVVRWPAYYLDFETVQTALPLYPDIAPYAQMVTQYSIHRCPAVGKVDAHHEYLADPQRDCQREVAQSLITDLGTEGSIIVYSPFESSRIGELAERLPDLAEPLLAIRARLFDLLQVVREHYYHPAFHGSYSIKTVLPVLVPEMSYSGLAIADGGAAMTVFARAALGQYSPTEWAEIRKNLLTYCGQDTMAMVQLHRVLFGLCCKF
jgi:hypothetical protein